MESTRENPHLSCCREPSSPLSVRRAQAEVTNAAAASSSRNVAPNHRHDPLMQSAVPAPDGLPGLLETGPASAPTGSCRTSHTPPVPKPEWGPKWARCPRLPEPAPGAMPGGCPPTVGRGLRSFQSWRSEKAGTSRARVDDAQTTSSLKGKPRPGLAGGGEGQNHGQGRGGPEAGFRSVPALPWGVDVKHTIRPNPHMTRLHFYPVPGDRHKPLTLLSCGSRGHRSWDGNTASGAWGAAISQESHPHVIYHAQPWARFQTQLTTSRMHTGSRGPGGTQAWGALLVPATGADPLPGWPRL